MTNETRRVLIIAATAIGINVLEAIIVPNVIEQPFDKNWKFKLPSAQVFAQTMGILAITALIGGAMSTSIIAALNGPQNVTPYATSEPEPQMARL